MGDPTSRAARYGYVRDKTALSITLSAQSVQVQLARLLEQLYACVTAEHATDALVAIRRFLLQGANLMQIDAPELLRQMQRLFRAWRQQAKSAHLQFADERRIKAQMEALKQKEEELRAALAFAHSSRSTVQDHFDRWREHALTRRALRHLQRVTEGQLSFLMQR